MRLRVVLLLCLSMGLLMFQLHHPVLSLPTEGSHYNYQISNRRTIQENFGEIHVFDQISSCQVTILQEILIGNRYLMRFVGYSNRYPYDFVTRDSLVDISINLLSFNLDAQDWDENNLSSYTRIDNTPDHYSIYDCDVFLVTPGWAAHEITWNNSVELIRDHPCVNHTMTAVYTSGRGEFQYTIVVNVEGYETIAGENLPVNGTTKFDFYCSYDGDGVLLQYSASSSNHYYDDLNQITFTSSVTITRAAAGPFFVEAYPFVIYQILLAVITLLVGIGCGFWVGKRQRRMQT